MSESAPLLSDVDENATRGANVDDEFEPQSNASAKHTPASAYFRPLLKVLAIVTLVVSVLTIGLLIANYIILRKAPLNYSYTWSAERVSKSLAKLMIVPVVFSIINVIVNFPILLNAIVDIALVASIIPRVVQVFDALPNSWWCQAQHRYPGEPIPPHPKCLHWKLVATIVMATSAGFAILVCVIYVVQLLLRCIAVYKTKLWKRPLSWTLPTGEITFQFSMRVLRQEGQSAQAEAGSAHGPVYLS